MENLKERECTFLEDCFKKLEVSDPVSNYFYGIYEGSADSLESILDSFFSLNSTSFSRTESHTKDKSHKRYSSTAPPVFEHRRGNIPIGFFGSPFMIESSEIRHCLHGSLKESRGGRTSKSSQRPEHDYGITSKPNIKFPGSRKVDCPASIQIRGINVFPDYEVKNCNTANILKIAKKNVLDCLKKDLECGKEVRHSMKYYVKIPLCINHEGHPVGEAVNHCLDRRVIAKIYDLVKGGVTRPDEVKRYLEEFVDREILADVPIEMRPKKNTRKYYPTRHNLRNHISKAISAQKYSEDDQESLRLKIEEWRENGDGKFFYRPRKEDAGQADNEEKPKNTFLFVHQEVWQQRMLERYGSQLVLMDAKYKTTKYALPLFFIYVYTNVGYKVVAEFICQNEDSDYIAEALAIVKSWNEGWSPSFFMVDFSTEEINAIEAQFPKAEVYLCDFQCIQAWQRWARTAESGLNSVEQENFLQLLRNVAYARTQEQYKLTLSKLRQSYIYKMKPNVQEYIDNVWMPCVKRWAQVYRRQEVVNIVNINNGVEAQNKVFKYDYLPRSVDKSVYVIAVMLVESFLPDSYQHYIDTNFKQSSAYRRFKDSIPAYLHNRPSHFIKHCIKSQFAADNIHEMDVECVNFVKGEFLVRGEDKKTKYAVKLDSPSCACEAWSKSHFPCKHFYAVFNIFEEWDFNGLPTSYKDSVFITLDMGAASLYISQDTKKDGHPDNLKRQMKEIDSDDDYGNSTDGVSQLYDEIDNEPTCSQSTPHRTSILRKSLLDELSSVRNLVYQIDNDDCLKKAIKQVNLVNKSLTSYCSTENGLPVRSSPQKKRLKVTNVDYHKVLHNDIPKHWGWLKKDKTKTQHESPEKVVNEDLVNFVVVLDSEFVDENGAARDQSVQFEEHLLESEIIATHDPVARVKAANQTGLALRDAMLKIRGTKQCVGDLWTVLPPREISSTELKRVRSVIPDFRPGWITDSVIDAFMYTLEANNSHVLAADCFLSQLSKRNGSTIHTWAGRNLSKVSLILFPLNQSGGHWTLLAFDKSCEKKLFFDPMSGAEKESVIVDPALIKDIERLGHLVRIKTGWEVEDWPCVAPKHCKQKDSYNCGVFICHFSRCLVEMKDLCATFDTNAERKGMLSVLFGSCYDDITSSENQRNVKVCKICRFDVNEDLLGCDHCGQFFHASCLGVDYAVVLPHHFQCP